MRAKHRIVFLGLLLLLCQCGKKAGLIDTHFIGIWNGHDNVSLYRLSIDQHSNAFWDRETNGHIVSTQGVAWIRNGDLHVGVKSLVINQYPVYDSASGEWNMILSGVTYTR